MKSYAAHVFVQRYQAQSEMESDWKNVNYHVAIHYQSRVKSMIEKSNLGSMSSPDLRFILTVWDGF